MTIININDSVWPGSKFENENQNIFLIEYANPTDNNPIPIEPLISHLLSPIPGYKNLEISFKN